MAPLPDRTAFLGLHFDPIGPEEAARAIASRARRGDAFAYVATPNVDHVVRLDGKPQLRAFYANAWLNLCDSRILEIFAGLSHLNMPAAPGADIVELLFNSHIDHDDAVTIIGGTPQMIDGLRVKFGLTNVRWLDAPHGLKDYATARATCVAFIRENPSPFIFLAVGSPQQEMIANEVVAAGGCIGVAVCCGAALEFLAGDVVRAPKWMRSNRLEWLYRLCSEPMRLWRRYLVDGPRIFGIWLRWEAERREASVALKGVAVSPH
jgi:exopolysaccharide biosynthesis WecB/TagA/CpsF family protein